MRAKPDCDHATVDDCGRTALVALTFIAGLRISPCLAAAGFQEMSPAFALDVASKGDAITGIKRADSASVNRCSVSCDPAEDAKKASCALNQSRNWRYDHQTNAQVP